MIKKTGQDADWMSNIDITANKNLFDFSSGMKKKAQMGLYNEDAEEHAQQMSTSNPLSDPNAVINRLQEGALQILSEALQLHPGHEEPFTQAIKTFVINTYNEHMVDPQRAEKSFEPWQLKEINTLLGHDPSIQKMLSEMTQYPNM
jgi:hypothetical protein